MTAELNHTIVASRDRWAAARLLADLLDLPAPVAFGPFAVVELHNGVSLDFADADGEITSQHYAFLVDDESFGAIAARLDDRGITTFADPGHHEPGQNTHHGGRGLYWDSPDGHNLEVLTRPYGSA